jgi:hypothetical protein
MPEYPGVSNNNSVTPNQKNVGKTNLNLIGIDLNDISVTSYGAKGHEKTNCTQGGKGISLSNPKQTASIAMEQQSTSQFPMMVKSGLTRRLGSFKS